MLVRLALSLLVAAPAAAALAAVLRGRPLRLGAAEASPVLADPIEIGVLAAVALAAIWILPRLRRGRALAALAGGLLVLAAALIVPPLAAPRPRTADGASAATPGGRRTLLVAVDGLSWNRIDALRRRGRLPNLGRLMEEGASATLHSLPARRVTTGEEGYWSPVVWTSIATGVGPERHGITDFSLPEEPGRLAIAASHHRRAPAFWNLFGAFGAPVGVVGWWATWPAEEVVGVMASSALGLRGRRGGPSGAPAEAAAEAPPAERLVHPPALEEELRAAARPEGDLERFLDRRLFPFSSYPLLAAGDRESFDAVIDQDRAYLSVARHLLRRQDLELVAVYFEGIDLVGHLFWRYLEDPEALVTVAVPDGFDEHAQVVDRYYGVIDGFIGELVRQAGPGTTVVICSDHGFRADPASDQGASHFGEGVLIARGAGIRAGAALNRSLAGWVGERLTGRVDVLDLLPTLLYLHGLPVADSLEGRILTRLLEPSWVREHPVRRLPGYGDFAATRRVELPPEARDEQLERLRTLGYID